MVKAPMPVITMIVKKVKMMRWRNMDNNNKGNKGSKMDDLLYKLNNHHLIIKISTNENHLQLLSSGYSDSD